MRLRTARHPLCRTHVPVCVRCFSFVLLIEPRNLNLRFRFKLFSQLGVHSAHTNGCCAEFAAGGFVVVQERLTACVPKHFSLTILPPLLACHVLY